MQFGATTPSMSSRLTSLGLVGALHGLIVLGLSAGLIRDALKPPPEPFKAEVLEPEPLPLPPQPLPEPLKTAKQNFKLPDVPIVQPDDWAEPQQAPVITTRRADDPATQVDAGPRREAPPELPPVIASGPVSAGLLCPTMARPELPAAAQEGSALLRVIGTVRGGRVVAVQMTTLQALPDRRAQRALLSNVEQALRSGYACTQDGQFEQEFLFRVE